MESVKERDVCYRQQSFMLSLLKTVGTLKLGKTISCAMAWSFAGVFPNLKAFKIYNLATLPVCLSTFCELKRDLSAFWLS